MSVTIEIDSAVYDMLAEEARPFVDSPNDVLRRLLGLDETDSTLVQRSIESSGSQISQEGGSGDTGTRGSLHLPEFPIKRRTRKVSRRAAGEMLPLEEFCIPILNALQNHGGELLSRDVPAAVEPLVDGMLRPADRELEDGIPAWHKRVGWAGSMCRKAGHLDPDAPRGIWRISSQGRHAVTQHVRKAGIEARQ